MAEDEKVKTTETKDTKEESREEDREDSRKDESRKDDREGDRKDNKDEDRDSKRRDRDDDKEDDRRRRKDKDDSRSPSRDSRSASRSRGRGRRGSGSRGRDRSRNRDRSRDRDRRDRGRDRGGSDDEERAREFGDDCYGRKLYVGNLDFRTDDRDLRDKFTRYGKVTDIFVPRDGRGDSRGFAFITFEDKRDAEDAVDGMHDSRLDGRRITCNIARPRPPLRDGGGYRGGGGGGRGRSRSRSREPSVKIYVGNLPMDVRESELDDIYSKFGRIVRIDLKTPNRPPAYAFIEFEDSRDAEDAVQETNGTKMGREYLRVEFSRSGGRRH